MKRTLRCSWKEKKIPVHLFELLVKNRVENRILVQLYKTYVRPHFDYGSLSFLPERLTAENPKSISPTLHAASVIYLRGHVPTRSCTYEVMYLRTYEPTNLQTYEPIYFINPQVSNQLKRYSHHWTIIWRRKLLKSLWMSFHWMPFHWTSTPVPLDTLENLLE